MELSIVGLMPAAGRGTRLGLPFPKELYPIVDDNTHKIVAGFVFEAMIAAEIKHIIFVVNETKHQLIGHFGSGVKSGAVISYVFQDSDKTTGKPLGLAHALDSACHLIKDKIVCFGMPDTIIYPSDVFKILLEKRTTADVVLALFKTNTPDLFGMVEVDKEGVVHKIIDKPKTDTGLKYMWGCMVWGPRFTEFLHNSVSAGILDFAQILNDSMNNGIIVLGVEIQNGLYTDVGTSSNISKYYRDTLKEKTEN